MTLNACLAKNRLRGLGHTQKGQTLSTAQRATEELNTKFQLAITKQTTRLLLPKESLFRSIRKTGQEWHGMSSYAKGAATTI
jgi:hypothetical protein